MITVIFIHIDDDEANNFNAYGDKHQPYLDVDRRAYDPVVEPQQLVTIEPVEAAERFKSGLEQVGNIKHIIIVHDIYIYILINILDRIR